MIAKVSALEAVPPGFTTVTLALPCEAIRVAATDAVSSVVLTKVVGRAEPFHRTAAPDTKPEPFTASVKAAPLAVAELGERPEIEGAGALVTVCVSTDDVLPGSFTPPA